MYQVRVDSDGHYLPDDDEVVCGHCLEPFLAELAQPDGLCPPCRVDPEEVLYLRSLLDGSLEQRLHEQCEGLERLRLHVLEELQRLRSEG